MYRRFDTLCLGSPFIDFDWGEKQDHFSSAHTSSSAQHSTPTYLWCSINNASVLSANQRIKRRWRSIVIGEWWICAKVLILYSAGTSKFMIWNKKGRNKAKQNRKRRKRRRRKNREENLRATLMCVLLMKSQARAKVCSRKMRKARIIREKKSPN